MSYPTSEQIESIRDLDDDDDRMKLVHNLILQARIEEADGFDHGNEAWSNNMTYEETQSDNPIVNYTERLKQEMFDA